MTAPAALDGVCVLDFSTVGPAARCAPVLAGMRRADETLPVGEPGATDTEEVLRAAGIAAREIDRMRSRGIVA